LPIGDVALVLLLAVLMQQWNFEKLAAARFDLAQTNGPGSWESQGQSQW